ncbi:MAG TPA: CbtA family protein [Acidimicrobiales bacterium]|nr:CbtA family protein [Acidimicrobiales bacterium]
MLARADFARPRTIVVAALVLGVVAGLAGAVFHTVATEPRLDEAVALEEAGGEGTRGAGGDHHEEVGEDGEVSVSRTDQKGVGLYLAYALTGASFGLLLAVTSLSLRTPGDDPFRRVVVSGTVLAGAVTVAPWLKYPPNPPGVSDAATVGERERLYVLAIVVVALVLAGLAHLSGRLRAAAWPDDRRVAAVVAIGLVVLAPVFGLLPPSPDPVHAPANLVWQFRLNSLTGNLLVWALLTVSLGVVWSGSVRSAARRARSAQNSMPLSADTPAS